MRGLPPVHEPCLTQGGLLPASPWRLIAYFPEGKQSCETTTPRPCKCDASKGQHEVGNKTWRSQRIELAENAYSDGKSERSRRVGKIPVSLSLRECPLCQEADPSINLRRRATMMVTIWRGRASVRRQRGRVRDRYRSRRHALRLDQVQVLGGSNSRRADHAMHGCSRSSQQSRLSSSTGEPAG
jgi:hypothetical protein